jgi:DNA-binding transcriptional ArsR family regulator
MNKTEKVDLIKEDFIKCKKILQAIGDETRQLIITVLMETSCTAGFRVGEITQRTHLSRPTVSHHIKILMDAEVIMMRKEGTKNYYYLNFRSKMGNLKDLVEHINQFLEEHY